MELLMGYVEIIPVKAEQLDICDECCQQGLKSSGKTVNDEHGDPVIFFCFNCVHKFKL
jgi:hypothetical protein